VGNVEILYRVNVDGTLNLRVFNRENNINYIGEGIGYTQGVGVSYEVDFDTFKELANKFFKNLKIERVNEAVQIDQDSDLPPAVKNDPKPKKPNTAEQKMNQEGKVPDEE
jgi:hypothetical protein